MSAGASPRDSECESNAHTFVIRPRIRVGPGDEFLVHPREKANWRIRQAVGKRLRSCRLFRIVTHPGLKETFGGRECLHFARRVGRDQAFQVSQGVFPELDWVRTTFLCKVRTLTQRAERQLTVAGSHGTL